MEDEFLRSLWASGVDEEASFLMFCDQLNGSEAKKEVMCQLVELMTEVKCPQEGENTSNLYRILVKKLREQFSDFNNDPEVMDVATKKLARWVEGLVKEAYYRKQGKIVPHVAKTEEVKKEDIKKVEEDVKELEDDVKKIEESEKETPNSLVVDGKEYVLKTDIQKQEKSKIGLRMERRARMERKQEPPVKIARENSLKYTYVNSNLESSSFDKSNNALRQIENDSDIELPTRIMTEKGGQIVLIKPYKGKKVIVDRETQISEVPIVMTKTEESKLELQTEANNNKKTVTECSNKVGRSQIEKPIITDSGETNKSQASKRVKPKTITEDTKPKHKIEINKKNVIAADNSVAQIEGTSVTQLVRGWSNWMLNLTKKARNLIRWDNSMAQVSQNVETTPDLEVREKWKQLMAENEALKKQKAVFENQQNKKEIGPSISEQSKVGTTSLESGIQTEKSLSNSLRKRSRSSSREEIARVANSIFSYFKGGSGSNS